MPRLRPLGRLRVADLTIALRADDPLPARDLVARLGLSARRSEDARPGPLTLRYDLLLRPARKRVVRDGRSLYAGHDAQDVVDALELDLLRALSARTGPTPLHAAALASGERAVLLVGASGAGKSTLARELIAHGLRYMGDEHAFLDDALRASGLPRAILSEGAPPLVPRADRIERRALPVALVVLLETPREPVAELTPRSPAQAAVSLAAAIHRAPRADDLARTSRLATGVPVVGLSREGAAAAARLVAEALG